MLKKISALCLSLSLCLGLLPAAAAVESPYDQAVAELRSKTGHQNERTIETEECTIFIFDRGGFMSALKGMMVLIYKAGSRLGAGTVVELPHARVQAMNVVTPADAMSLSEDGTTFTYTYRVEEPVVVGNTVIQEAGVYTYTADLPTGEVTVRGPEGLPSSSAPTEFSDVPAGSWFAEGVRTCARKGVMVGTGGSAFSPERTLSQAECLTLAFRLYDLVRGQEHVIERDPEVNSLLYDAVCRKAAPAPWWQDTAYTIAQRGLEDVFDPAEFTDAPASRGFFARLMAAAGEGYLGKGNAVETIPDLPREKDNTAADTYREAAYTLYEAGILTGVDQAGTFAAGNTLTRAEAAVMAARVLDKDQRVTVPSKTSGAYDKAVSALRESSGYRDEVIYESELCSVFSYGIGGTPHGYHAMLELIYKAGSPLGEGTEVSLPLIEKANGWRVPLSPDVISLNKDRSVLTYLYHLEENNSAQLPPGEYRYTVELASGEVSTAYLPGQ